MKSLWVCISSTVVALGVFCAFLLPSRVYAQQATSLNTSNYTHGYAQESVLALFHTFTDSISADVQNLSQGTSTHAKNK